MDLEKANRVLRRNFFLFPGRQNGGKYVSDKYGTLLLYEKGTFIYPGNKLSEKIDGLLREIFEELKGHGIFVIES